MSTTPGHGWGSSFHVHPSSLNEVSSLITDVNRRLCALKGPGSIYNRVAIHEMPISFDEGERREGPKPGDG